MSGDNEEEMTNAEKGDMPEDEKDKVAEIRENLSELEKIQSVAENPNFQKVKEIMFQEKELTTAKTHFTTGKIANKEKK
ncbi:17519_t:CDS:2 [Funneliformis geosporum]|nr:17519_t:CDS:2 [Funneliformis geosporum]